MAALLRFERPTPDVLLMVRADDPRDRWSGQVSFPGGREDPIDPSLRHTAMRETLEEVGIDLASSARCLGQLPPVRAVARGKVRPMTITPFVFVQTGPVAITHNYEVQDTFWLPLDQAASGALSSTYEYEFGPLPMAMPCWRYHGRVIWGLTFRMLTELLEVVGVSPAANVPSPTS